MKYILILFIILLLTSSEYICFEYQAIDGDEFNIVDSILIKTGNPTITYYTDTNSDSSYAKFDGRTSKSKATMTINYKLDPNVICTTAVFTQKLLINAGSSVYFKIKTKSTGKEYIDTFTTDTIFIKKIDYNDSLRVDKGDSIQVVITYSVPGSVKSITAYRAKLQVYGGI